MNRGDIRRRALYQLNDDQASPVFWDDLDTELDEAIAVLAEEAELFKRTITLPQRPGTAWYTLQGFAPAIMTPWRIYSHQKACHLWPVSMGELNRHFGNTWLTLPGTPEYWYAVSWDMFGVFPAPAQGGGVLDIDCFVWPTSSLDDKSLFEFSAQDSATLVSYLVAEGLAQQWDIDRAATAMGEVMARWKDTKARHGMRAIQARFFQRGDAHASSGLI